ncbi:hypothetical protein C8F01DRAFT_1150131 [Mycena amicta]|nr:hypothetical protein C8F01DRAFT_1150131 [Mycena amicta]
MVDGAMNLVYGEARRVRLGEVTVALRNEEGQDIQEVTIPWNMLVFATGCTQSAPGNVQGIADLGAFQARIAAQTTQRIAVIGGGAVGVELSADIRTFFPDKELVRVYQSRERLLPAFGLRLGEHAEKVLGDLGVEVVCGQRPEILGEKTLRTKDGEEEFDLIIPCTGQKPNSTLLKDIAPDAISNESGHILVQPTLQILTASESDALSRVFALGDVAQSGGPKMARAAQFQTEIVIKNICALAKESQARHVYTPNHFFEGSIKLTLGRGRIVVYGEENVDGKGSVLLEAKQRDDESGVKMAWWRLSAKYQPPK